MNSTTTTTRKPADRELRAYEQLNDYLVLAGENDGEFYVLNGKGDTYTTTTATCTCPDFKKRGQTCKHSFMVQFAIEAEAPKPAPVAAPVRPLDPYHAGRALAKGLDAEAYRAECRRSRDELFD